MSLQDADNNLKFTKCDAVMSAYGLLRNPYLFESNHGPTPWSAARGIMASQEYLEMVKTYGIPLKSLTNSGYHLAKFLR